MIVCACSTSSGTASQPQCSTILADGATLTSAQFNAGCVDAGKPRRLTAWNCHDGRKLYGNDGVWGFVDDRLHAVPVVADDPEYKAAFTACTS